jgi:RND family efflux transporter MFP subunit
MIRYGKRQGVVILLFLTVLLGGCGNEREEIGRSPFPEIPVAVEIISVAVTEVADQVEIMATVQAAKTAVISSRISGYITSLAVIPGSRVSAGRELLQLSAGEISAQLEQAKAQLDQASRNLQRERKLLSQNAATPEAVKALEDAANIAEAGYKEAMTMMSYTTVRSPFDGLITRKLADIGDLATPGKPLLHIENDKDLQVLTDIPESLVANIQLGMEMEISIPAAQLKLQGSVVEIAPIADPRSRTVPIKLDIPEYPALGSGQFARITLPGRKVETILVPPRSIDTFGQMERVFISVEGTARLRLVRTGKHYSRGIEILSGLTPGDKLILSDERLRDFQPITPL